MIRKKMEVRKRKPEKGRKKGEVRKERKQSYKGKQIGK